MYLSLSPAAHQPLHKRAAIATLLVHAGVLALLWWGARWIAPQPTEVELWDAGSLGGNTVMQANDAVPAAAPLPNTMTSTPVTPSISEPPELAKPDIATPAAPASKPAPEPQKPQSVPTPNKPESRPPVPNKSQANPAARTDVLAQTRTGASAGAGSGTGSGSASGSGNANYASYVGKVKSMIENRGRNQGLAGIAGRVSFRVAPNGAVTSVTVSGMPPDKAETLKRVISGMVLPRDEGVIPQPVLSGGMSFSVRI